MADLLPGAWLLGVGAGLTWALRRWWERPPIPVLALFAVVIALFYGEVLVGGRVLLPLDNLRGEAPFRELAPTQPHGNLLQGDLLYVILPARLEVRRALAAGAWPLWNGRVGAGMPLLADPQAQALQPLALLALPLPAGQAAGGLAALRTLLALLFAFLLLRRLGCATGPALAGSLAYGLGGFLQLWLGWPLANTAVWLPAALYAVILADERGRRRDWGLLVGCLAGLLLAGHPETVLYALALVAGLALLRWRLRARGSDRRGRKSFALRCAASLAGAALLAAPALLPFAEYLPETLRWERLRGGGGEGEPEVAAAAALGGEPAGGSRTPPPASRLVQAAAPNAFGNSLYFDYWGWANSNEDAAGFVGTAALLAALLALPGWLAGQRPVRHELAALAVAGGTLVLLALPGGLSGRLALPLDLALAVAAAATLERFRRGGVAPWLRWVALPTAVAGLAGLHLLAYRELTAPGAPETLDVLRWGWVHWHLRFLALAGVPLFVAGGRAGSVPRWARAGLAPAFALWIAAELFLAHRPVNPALPRLATAWAAETATGAALPLPPALALLDERLADGAGGPAGHRVVGEGAALLPNLAAVYGMADARIFNPMAPARYVGFLAPAMGGWRGEIPLLGRRDEVAVPAEWDRVLDRLGVGWYLAPPGAACPQGAAAAYDGADAVVCRRPGARPLLWREGERLATAIYAAPGWRVLADGVARAPAADEVLLRAPLPRGARRVALVYRPWGFVAGCLLAACGLALAMAWLARPPG